MRKGVCSLASARQVIVVALRVLKTSIGFVMQGIRLAAEAGPQYSWIDRLVLSIATFVAWSIVRLLPTLSNLSYSADPFDFSCFVHLASPLIFLSFD